MQIFLSAVSIEFLKHRKMLKADLSLPHVKVQEQEDFVQGEGKLLQTLDTYIRDHCDAVIHLVGEQRGQDVKADELRWLLKTYSDFATRFPFLDEELHDARAALTYTQMEAWLALYHGKRCHLYRPKALAIHPLPDDNPQQRHWQRLKDLGEHRGDFEDPQHLCRRVLRDLNDLWPIEFPIKRPIMAWAIIGILLCTLTIFGVVFWPMARRIANNVEATARKTDTVLEKFVEENERDEILTANLKAHTRKKADEEIAIARNSNATWQEVNEIEQQRDLALENIEQASARLGRNLRGQSNSLLQEAIRIGKTEGIEQSLRFLEERRPEIDQRIISTEARASLIDSEFRAELEPLLFQAELYESDLDWDNALKLYKFVVAKAPLWSRAQQELGFLLVSTGHHDSGEQLLRDALKNARDDDERQSASNKLGRYFIETKNWEAAEPLFKQTVELRTKLYGENASETAAALSNLAWVYYETNKFPKAEGLMRRALVIDEILHAPNHPEVAIRLNNLAMLFQKTKRLELAEPLMRRMLRIDEGFYGLDHPNCAIDLGNLAWLLQNTNRMTEAEPLMRHDLVIHEQVYGPGHPKVSRAINNLGKLLNEMKMPTEAEPLLRRAVSIMEEVYGPNHVQVSTVLNNLSQLLKETKRPSEAELLLRRALSIVMHTLDANDPSISITLNNLALLLTDRNRVVIAESFSRRSLVIDEEVFGPGHPRVASNLTTLGKLLAKTNRREVAEPLMRRAVIIFQLYLDSTGHEHGNAKSALRDYRQLLDEWKLPSNEVEKRITAIPDAHEPLDRFVPEVERLLGSATPISEALMALDEEYKSENKPDVYRMLADQPISPHLDMLLGPDKFQVPLDQPITPKLFELLGRTGSVKDVLDELDRQYRDQSKPAFWRLELSEPISPYLDKLLGPISEVPKQ